MCPPARNVSVSFRQLVIFAVVVSWVEKPGAVGGNDSVSGTLRRRGKVAFHLPAGI